MARERERAAWLGSLIRKGFGGCLWGRELMACCWAAAWPGGWSVERFERISRRLMRGVGVVSRSMVLYFDHWILRFYRGYCAFAGAKNDRWLWWFYKLIKCRLINVWNKCSSHRSRRRVLGFIELNYKWWLTVTLIWTWGNWLENVVTVLTWKRKITCVINEIGMKKCSSA